MSGLGGMVVRLYAYAGVLALVACAVDMWGTPVRVGEPVQAVSVSGLTKTETQIVAELMRRMDAVELRADAAVDGADALWWLLEQQKGCFAPGGAGGGDGYGVEGIGPVAVRDARGASASRGPRGAAPAHAVRAEAVLARGTGARSVRGGSDARRAPSAQGGVRP